MIIQPDASMKTTVQQSLHDVISVICNTVSSEAPNSEPKSKNDTNFLNVLSSGSVRIYVSETCMLMFMRMAKKVSAACYVVWLQQVQTTASAQLYKFSLYNCRESQQARNQIPETMIIEVQLLINIIDHTCTSTKNMSEQYPPMPFYK